ncbi:MAG: hypothetical protein ABI626_03185 [Sphingomicrobium sp.]
MRATGNRAIAAVVRMLAAGLALAALAAADEPSLPVAFQSRDVATTTSHVRSGSLKRGPAAIPISGHWLMEEPPSATVAVVRAFLDSSLNPKGAA